MTRHPDPRRRRAHLRSAAVEAPRALWGTRLLRRPGSGGEVVLSRLVGARHLAQAVGTALVTGPTGHRLGAVVDGVHAATMLPLLASPRMRGTAGGQLISSVAFAALETAVARGGERRGRS